MSGLEIPLLVAGAIVAGLIALVAWFADVPDRDEISEELHQRYVQEFLESTPARRKRRALRDSE